MKPFVAVALGVGVNCAWGLSFLAPRLLPQIDPVLITAGRFVTYGLLSMAVLLGASRGGFRRFRPKDWLWALLFAFAGNVGYYLLVLMAVRLGGVTVPAVIIGTLPVTMAVYGGWSEGNLRVRRLALPLALILCGLVAMNLVRFVGATSAAEYHTLWITIALSLVALASWTWYGVKNAEFVKAHPNIGETAWCSAVGTCTLMLSVALMPVLAAFGVWSPRAAVTGFADWRVVAAFVLASLVLGVVISWLSTLLWNGVSRALPVSVSGQLVVFETLSSVLYVNLLDKSVPPVLEWIGLTSVVFGVLLGLRRTLPGRCEAASACPPAPAIDHPVPAPASSN